MSFDLKTWSGQVTTGIGMLLATPTALALLAGQITWQQAIPPLVAAAIGLLWPEAPNAPAQGKALATDLEAVLPLLIKAYSTGISHADAATAPAVTQAAPAPWLAPAPVVPAPSTMPSAKSLFEGSFTYPQRLNPGAVSAGITGIVTEKAAS